MEQTDTKFDDFVRKYKRWSGKTITPQQREQMYEALTKRGLDLELDKLINKLESNPPAPSDISDISDISLDID